MEVMTKKLENIVETYSETWWGCTTATLLGVLFGTYRRRCRNVIMRPRRYVPLRRLGDVTLRCCWVFYLRLV